MPELVPESADAEAAPANTRRSIRDVFEDHLRLRVDGELERDIDRNYHPGVVLMHFDGVERGHAGVRRSSTRLGRQLPDASFTRRARHVSDAYAHLEWSATSEKARVRDGADSFVIHDGRIVMQSIHYTLEEAPNRAGDGEAGREETSS